MQFATFLSIQTYLSLDVSEPYLQPFAQPGILFSYFSV